MGLNGDEAVAYATKQVNPDVVAAYPITPQTIIVERFSEYVADGIVDTEFVAVESEHSAMSCSVGASAAGARAFTATAANGLALMWEILYIASSLRLPIVMAVANRALSGPINIHNDHSDSMGARDSGWIQIYCENAQEVYDASVTAWRIGEHLKIQLPVMVCLDGFTLSHTMENVMTLPDEVVQKFVGERPFINVEGHLGEAELRLNPDAPLTMGPLDLQDFYFEHKMHQVEALKDSLKFIKDVEKEWAKVSGRSYEYVEPYLMDDAEVAVIGMGSAMGTVRHVVDELRAEGVKAGVIKLRLFRPFPVADLKKAVGSVPALGVMEKCISFGAPASPLMEEIMTAYYHDQEKPMMANYVVGLGGKDVSPTMIREIYSSLLTNKKAGKVSKLMSYIGVRGE
ncbi:MAG TPA: transketolase C-terminal domain-containing protein [Candidatus Desulfaltia sp.]|nr:transketolase C-terminal domain-containing protein [Candidatus Desulfaltia sp.]